MHFILPPSQDNVQFKYRVLDGPFLGEQLGSFRGSTNVEALTFQEDRHSRKNPTSRIGTLFGNKFVSGKYYIRKIDLYSAQIQSLDDGLCLTYNENTGYFHKKECTHENEQIFTEIPYHLTEDQSEKKVRYKNKLKNFIHDALEQKPKTLKSNLDIGQNDFFKSRNEKKRARENSLRIKERAIGRFLDEKLSETDKNHRNHEYVPSNNAGNKNFSVKAVLSKIVDKIIEKLGVGKTIKDLLEPFNYIFGRPKHKNEETNTNKPLYSLSDYLSHHPERTTPSLKKKMRYVQDGNPYSYDTDRYRNAINNM